MKPDKRIIYGIYAFTFVVYLLVIILHELPGAEQKPGFTNFQPQLHAILNGSCFIALILSLVAVKNGKIIIHKRLNTVAMLLSLVFLLSYVLYHYFAQDTAYGGNYQSTYYTILISHIFLAGLSLPFILLSYYHGYIGNIKVHRKLAFYTYPVWLYVTFTGVLVYLFLAPYYA